MADLPTLNNAWLSIKDDIIEDYGSMDDWKGVDDWTDLEVIDASDRLVLPCWCDSHTHLVYAGSRETEFVDRINGLSYGEIAKNGGGILNSAKRLSETNEDTLIEQALERLKEISLSGNGKKRYLLTPLAKHAVRLPVLQRERWRSARSSRTRTRWASSPS